MNRLTLAVAGGRKTQSIVDRCTDAPPGHQVLVLTYTLANQRELVARLAARRPLEAEVEVRGWFSFLLRLWIRPYLPSAFPNRRLRGLNFDGDPGRYATGAGRYLDAEGRAYKLHLADLAMKTSEACAAAVIDRLARIYDEIYIDEVQDLNGYDLEVLIELMKAPIELRLVGDVRQALLLTNPREPKNKQFKGIRIKEWFDAQEKAGRLEITHAAATWRSNQVIADFADALFDASWGFAKTVSENTSATDHDGVFVVEPQHVEAYVDRYRPLCLRHSAASAKALDLPFVNFGLAKGLSVDRVLIAPTGPIVDFLRKQKPLEDTTACSLYVAVTRARSSAAFICRRANAPSLPVWEP